MHLAIWHGHQTRFCHITLMLFELFHLCLGNAAPVDAIFYRSIESTLEVYPFENAGRYFMPRVSNFSIALWEIKFSSSHHFSGNKMAVVGYCFVQFMIISLFRSIDLYSRTFTDVHFCNPYLGFER